MIDYILPFLILIMIVVFIHEYGHYYFARKYGVEDFVDIERFGIVVLIFDDLFNHGRFILEKTRQTLSL